MKWKLGLNVKTLCENFWHKASTEWGESLTLIKKETYWNERFWMRRLLLWRGRHNYTANWTGFKYLDTRVNAFHKKGRNIIDPLKFLAKMWQGTSIYSIIFLFNKPKLPQYLKLILGWWPAKRMLLEREWREFNQTNKAVSDIHKRMTSLIYLEREFYGLLGMTNFQSIDSLYGLLGMTNFQSIV